MKTYENQFKKSNTLTYFEVKRYRVMLRYALEWITQCRSKYTVWHWLSSFHNFSRKMLIADINELKYQQEDAKKPNAEEEGEGKEDVTFLKLALKWVMNILLQVSSTDCSVQQAWASVLDEVLNDFLTAFYWFSYNNQINVRALIGQSAMVYCVGKRMEKSGVFWIKNVNKLALINRLWKCKKGES